MSLLLLLTETSGGQVEITFVLPDGTPLAEGITVTVLNTSTNETQTATTDANGTVQLTILAGQTYNASFSGSGAPATVSTFIGTGQNQIITVYVIELAVPTPPPPPPPPPPLYTQGDFAQRIISTIPKPWFSDAARTDTGDTATTGVLFAIAWGIASGFGYIASTEIPYTRNQSRWATRSDNNLDLAAYDIFGQEMQRLTGEMPSNPTTDASYSLRIRKRIAGRLQTLDAILAAVVNYYLAAQAATADRLLQDLALGTIGGIGTRGGLSVYQNTKSGLLVPNVYVFDTKSDPASATAYSITYGQVAIVIEWSTDSSAFYENLAHLDRETFLGQVDQVFDTGQFGVGSCPDPNLGIVVNRVKAGGIRPIYIVKLSE